MIPDEPLDSEGGAVEGGEGEAGGGQSGVHAQENLVAQVQQFDMIEADVQEFTIGE